MKILLFFVGLLCFNQVEAKQRIYKWTDADGNTHYSEQKPQNKQVDEVKVYAGPSSVKSVNVNNNKADVSVPNEEKSEAQKAIDEYNAKEKQRVNKLQAKQNCKVAKQNLATLQRSSMIKQKDPETGKYSYMDNSQRDSMFKLAKKTIKEDCK